MSKTEFDPARALGDRILDMDRQELCALAVRICLRITAEAGPLKYRGGIFPENISIAEDGSVAIGPAKMEKWKRQELEFIAPELYWHGESCPASDVYSLGLLLFYATNGGKLPFATALDSGQLSRMSGKHFSAPEAAGPFLGAVIERATAFKAANRYENVDDLRIMLEASLDNKYLTGAPGSKSLFQKEASELSEMEKMMLSILGGTGASRTEPEPEEAGTVLDLEKLMQEPAPEPRPKRKPIEPDAEMQLLLEEFNTPLAKEPEYPVDDGEEGTLAKLPLASDEDVRVYKPREKRDPNGQSIPILTEEKNPELAPIVVKPRPRTVRQEHEVQREKQIAEENAERRLLPLVVVLGLSLILIVGAGLANYLLNHRSPRPAPAPSQVVVTPEQTEAPAELPAETPDVAVSGNVPIEPYYEAFLTDVSWTEAQRQCLARGGHLAVIDSEEEFRTVTDLAAQAGITRLWLGCRRINNQLVWERESETPYFLWAQGEPSYFDVYDSVSEDYIMAWYRDGVWSYNDSRDDPVSDYPGMYSGTIGYVCEYGS
jgi:hypothetical protein